MAKNKVIGIDEAGRGPWAGPVVAAAFCFLKDFTDRKDFIKTLKDSKKLNPKARKNIFHNILKLSETGKAAFSIGITGSEIIDSINIRQANRSAMQNALSDLISNLKDNVSISKIQIDGNDNYIFDGNDIPVEFIIRGDDKIDEIKAASIIAKVVRDELMIRYSEIYSGYQFEMHKGYGTKKHQEALAKHGPCPIHRKSYKPIKNMLISG